MITRKYCLAVRSALTDDGHPPLAAPGLKLYKRLSLIVASLERVAQIRALPSPLDKLYRLLTKGVAATEPLWSDVQAGYGWVYRAVHALANADHLSSKEVERQYEEVLEEMRNSVSLTAPLQQMTATFLKVTASYQPGLFHCYDVADLPRTNNDLEHVFGSTRYHERRATGRKQASPGLVVRGSVRLVAAIATQNYHFSGPDLARAIRCGGEHSESRLTIVMKLAVNTFVFVKTLNATYILWRSSYPREQCVPRKKTS